MAGAEHLFQTVWVGRRETLRCAQSDRQNKLATKTHYRQTGTSALLLVLVDDFFLPALDVADQQPQAKHHEGDGQQ